jgi:hypothetical protein
VNNRYNWRVINKGEAMSKYPNIPQSLKDAIASYEEFSGDVVSLRYTNPKRNIECGIVSSIPGNSFDLVQPGKTKTGRKRTSKNFTANELTEILQGMSRID